eukprot:941676-Amphidinium_carterae.1
MLSVTVSKIDVAKRVVIAVFDADGSSWKSVPFSMFSRKEQSIIILQFKACPNATDNQKLSLAISFQLPQMTATQQCN